MHFDVKEFGAAGDGITDDTDAIQAAVNAASRATQHWVVPIAPQIAASPVIYFPAGVYKIRAPIGLPVYTSVLGEHAILAPDAGSIDIFISNTSHFYEMSFRGMTFHGGRNAITVAQARVSETVIQIDDCEFIEQQGSAICTTGTSGGTLIIVSRCRFFLSNPASHVALLWSVDECTFRDCWVNAAGDVFVVGSSDSSAGLFLDRITGVPNDSTGSWIKNINGVIRAEGCRFGGEGGGKRILQNFTSANLTSSGGIFFVTIRDCACDTPANVHSFEFFALPNRVVIADNGGFYNVGHSLFFDPAIPDSVKKAIGTRVVVSIDGNVIDPFLLHDAGDSVTCSQLLNASRIERAGYIEADDRVFSAPSLSGAHVPNQSAGPPQQFPVETGSTDAFGQLLRRFAATVDASFIRWVYTTALAGLPAGDYAAVFHVEVSSLPVTVSLIAADVEKPMSLEVGKWILSMPFRIFGSSSRGLGIQLLMNNGAVAGFGGFRVFKGHKVVDSVNTIAIGTSLPSSQRWVAGDRVLNGLPAAGGAEGWVCLLTGTACATPWQPNTSFAMLGMQVSNAGNVYLLTQVGTSNPVGPGPVGQGSNIADNQCRWDFVDVQAVFHESGRLVEKGTSVLVNGRLIVNHPSVTPSSQILFAHRGTGVVGNFGVLYKGPVVPGTSFEIRSTNVNDDDSVEWQIFN